MEAKRSITQDTAIRCLQCGALAAYEVQDCIEVPSRDWRGWREFEVSEVRRGCLDHPVTAMTTYRDGRELPSADCVPEKVQWRERIPAAWKWLKNYANEKRNRN